MLTPHHYPPPAAVSSLVPPADAACAPQQPLPPPSPTPLCHDLLAAPPQPLSFVLILDPLLPSHSPPVPCMLGFSLSLLTVVGFATDITLDNDLTAKFIARKVGQLPETALQE